MFADSVDSWVKHILPTFEPKPTLKETLGLRQQTVVSVTIMSRFLKKGGD